MACICDVCIHKEVCEWRVSKLYSDFTKCSDFISERPHGKWKIDGALIACNLCGRIVLKASELYNYCPNCGADMRGDTNG